MNITDDTKTQWFSAKTNPARDGWYEVRYNLINGTTYMRYFRGGSWFLDDDELPLRAAYGRAPIEAYEQWRGLKEQA